MVHGSDHRFGEEQELKKLPRVTEGPSNDGVNCPKSPPTKYSSAMFSSASCRIHKSNDHLYDHHHTPTSKQGFILSDSSTSAAKPLRLVKKTGRINVVHTNRRRRYLNRFISDIFTTLVDLRWSAHLLVCALFYLISWTVFGLLYYVIIIKYDEKALGDQFDLERPFTGAFLFSLETQTTIGYGRRFPSSSSPVVIVLVVTQSVYGLAIEAYVVGALMSKLTRAKKRAETILFSESAVINRHKNDCKYLMFRVGNLQKSPVLEATIKAFYISTHVTQEDEFLPMRQIPLPLNSGNLYLTTPQLVTHHINRSSPLWDWRESRWWLSEFEIVVVLEGVVAGTGMITQARTSYVPGEISWGHRFLNVVSFDDVGGKWNMCLSRFHVTEKFQNIYEDDDDDVVEVEPRCSVTPQHSLRSRDSPKVVVELRRDF